MPRSREINTKRLYFTGRLMQAMSKILEYPLTIVEAPMGYGKTTAVREQLNRAGITPIWLRVYASDTAVFWNSFAKLIGELDAGCSDSLMQLGFPNDAVSMGEASRLLSRLALTAPAVIVIDDYHHLDSAELNAFFELLAEEGILNLHIVLTARYIKLKRLEEFSLKKCLHHITKEAFELTPPEIAEYFKACGIRLSGEEALKLFDMTEGWISALYLFLLEYVSEGAFTSFESIYRLLEKAVYSPLDEESKRVLLSMCLFDGFTGRQAEYIQNDESAGRILLGLAGGNSFVSYDNRSKTFSIHGIFTDFLREELDKWDFEYKTELYRRSAGWYRQERDFAAARKYCFMSGDFDGLLTALEEDAAIDYSAHDKDLLKEYMAACPEAVKARHPFAMLKFALPLFVHNETELFGQVCAALAGSVGKDKSLDIDQQNRLLGGLELLLSLSYFNNLEEMAPHQKKAWELLGRPAEIFSKNIHWNFGSPSILYLYYRESGKLKEQTAALIENLPLYCRLTNGHGAGGGDIMEAERQFCSGNFEDAEIALQKAVLTAKAAEESNNLLCCEFLRARLDFLRGDHASLFDRLKAMRETMAHRKLYNYLHTVEICEGFVYAWLGLKDKLPDMLLEADPKTLRLGFPAFGVLNILRGRAMLVRGEYLKLLGSGDYFTAAASVFPNVLGLIYTDIYMAAANHRIYRRDEALQRLKKALDTALPDALYMPFVENCDYIEPLLQELSGEISYRDGIAKILRLYATFCAGKERIISGSAEKPALSGREKEIAVLAADGLSNKEIGKLLAISENTVKSAMKSVYIKLSVNDRLSLKKALTETEKQK